MDETIEELVERLACLGGVSARRMFGGHGLYREGLFFALVARGVLYFKVDDSNRADYEAEGMGPFTYDRDGKPAAMSYYEAPLAVLEDPTRLRAWGLAAWEVARRAQGRRRKAPHKTLRSLKNLGPKSVEWLAEAGIRTRSDLEATGSVEAFRRVRALGLRPSLNLLYALEGALMDLRWNLLPAEVKERLKAGVGEE